MALAFEGGAAGGLLTPTPNATQENSNYTDIVTLNQNKMLPDTYSDLAERFGNQTIQGFLAQTGAESPLKSDTASWAEEGRLNLYYEDVAWDVSANQLTFDADSTETTHALRVGQVLLIGTGANEDIVQVTTRNSDTVVTVANYNSTYNNNADTDLNVRVIGSDFAKGSAGMDRSVESRTTNYTNGTFIAKDKYAVSGSDATAISWIKVEGGAESSATGQGGWLWYIKSEMDARKRFLNLIETQSLESIEGHSSFSGDGGNHQGVFDKVSDDGITTVTPFSTDTFDNFIDDVDSLVKELDKQGSIQENLMWLNREESLAVDSGLALANGAFSGGSYYGAFDNEQMAINLGFKTWTRGSYTFHKTDWKYLNDATGRSGFGTSTKDNIRGLMVPAGSMMVYDGIQGGSIKRPYLHIRYRASQSDNRKFKHWLTGSVGVQNSDIDAMEVNYLTERSVIVQAANNFVLFN